MWNTVGSPASAFIAQRRTDSAASSGRHTLQCVRGRRSGPSRRLHSAAGSSQTLLANAQQGWLLTAAARKVGVGRLVARGQRLANRGQVVVASYRNSNPHRPGHIALVRPSTKSAATRPVASEGPDLIWAGRAIAIAAPFRKASAAIRRTGFFSLPIPRGLRSTASRAMLSPRGGLIDRKGRASHPGTMEALMEQDFCHQAEQ